MDSMQFLDILDAALSERELAALCRQFSLSYNAFPGATQRDRTREFVGYMQRQGRMAGLAEATVALRPDLGPAVARVFAADDPHLDWLDRMNTGAGGSLDSGVTWRWPAAYKGAAPLAGAPDGEPPADETPTVPITAPSTPAGAPVSAPAPPTAEPPPNPYTPGRPVADDAMFFGRAAEAELLRAHLAEGGHVAIVGQRTLGGSSLLRWAARHAAGERALPALVDARDPAVRTLPGLLNTVWTQWWAVVKPGNVTLVRTLAEFVTAARKLRAAGFRPLLFLDEFEQLIWRPAVFDDGLYDAWHELGREGALGLAVASHSAPADLLAQGGFHSRMYELFRPFDLGLLDEAAARDLLTVPAERAGLAVPAGAADHLLAQAGPHPFFLQLAGLYLFDGLARGQYSRAEVTAQFEAAAIPFWQELWDNLSPPAQAHYPAAALREKEGVAGRQLRTLAHRGLLVAEGDAYRPFSEGFANWLARLRAAQEFNTDFYG
ncbi:hypothetical protein [Promineifilum sp.]|uniref:nSTAND1 domain-containing NTPase n=1 Tax=Promineifilum sp. TaxID=2664178 RepID=UPI0035B1F395